MGLISLKRLYHVRRPFASYNRVIALKTNFLRTYHASTFALLPPAEVLGKTNGLTDGLEEQWIVNLGRWSYQVWFVERY